MRSKSKSRKHYQSTYSRGIDSFRLRNRLCGYPLCYGSRRWREGEKGKNGVAILCHRLYPYASLISDSECSRESDLLNRVIYVSYERILKLKIIPSCTSPILILSNFSFTPFSFSSCFSRTIAYPDRISKQRMTVYR